MKWMILSQYCLAVCVLTGCGGNEDAQGPIGSLAGTVLIDDGTPLTEGLVYLQQVGGPGAGGGSVGSDGTFEISGGAKGGIPVGTYTVWFAPSVIPDPDPDDPMTEETEKEMAELPEKYRSNTTSTLSVEIGEGGNVEIFKLTP